MADEWELQWDDIEIHYDEELGNGAFGRVYRGVLHSRELRQLVSEEDASNRRWSLTRKKSPTRRKPTVHRDLGSCVVAIKRLKGLPTTTCSVEIAVPESLAADSY